MRDSAESQAFVLVSYPEDEDPGDIVRRSMSNPEFAEETRDWIDRWPLVLVSRDRMCKAFRIL